MNKKLIKIGTRDSQLALWQANLVANLLQKQGIETELVLIKSEGDINLKVPLYQMGIQGIFTKTLDIALLNNQIDIAVHSFKDVPTIMAEGLETIAIIERGNPKDILIFKDNNIKPENEITYTIATSSLRRKAQWLNRYPTHQIEDLRGNIQTRLKKLNDNKHWHGALFAAAGIERLKADVNNYLFLDWMLPAPAQGAIAVVAQKNQPHLQAIGKNINHQATEICTKVERDFLRTLQGGCSMPIAAHAFVNDNNQIIFKGNILTIDGKEKAEIETSFDISEYANAGKQAAELLKKEGGQNILLKLQKEKLTN